MAYRDKKTDPFLKGPKRKVLAVVFGMRVWLWRNLRDGWHRRRIAISTAQLTVVAGAVSAYDFIGEEVLAGD
jgi:hypothetical protein